MRNIVLSAAVLVLSETVLVIDLPRITSRHNMSSGN